MTMQKGIVPTSGSAAGVKLSADSFAYIVEQLQMARWLLEQIEQQAPAGIDESMIRRRVAALAMLVEQLVEGAAHQGVALEVDPQVMQAAEMQAARRSGPAH
jgi:hypothetical protein